jgi:hypothetical protein
MYLVRLGVDLAAALSAFVAAILWWLASVSMPADGAIAIVRPHFEHTVLDVTRVLGLQGSPLWRG